MRISFALVSLLAFFGLSIACAPPGTAPQVQSTATASSVIPPRASGVVTATAASVAAPFRFQQTDALKVAREFMRWSFQRGTASPGTLQAANQMADTLDRAPFEAWAVEGGRWIVVFH